MRVLAIDTALAACSAAVFDAQQQTLLAGKSLAMVRGHAEALIPLIGQVMDEADIAFLQVDRVAVTVGPGSFTGLRVGIAAARAIALASGRPAVGISTLAAYAAPCIAEDDSIPVLAAIDARHNQVYLQGFGAGGRTLIGPRIVSALEAVQSATEQTRIVGSGANLVLAAWPQDKSPPSMVRASPAPDINWVARLGTAAPQSNAPPKPLYLRAPDAQPQNGARLPRR